jgi:CheY-like chemotaxis protein
LGAKNLFCFCLREDAGYNSVVPDEWDPAAVSGIRQSFAGGSMSKGRTMNILLVDDHEDTSRALKRLLERLGYCVSTANCVSKALEVSGTSQVDVLISDIGLPDGSGLDLMRTLLSRNEELKGVALSGYGLAEDVRASKEAGFAEHLTKPVPFGTLRGVLDRLTSEPVGR